MSRIYDNFYLKVIDLSLLSIYKKLGNVNLTFSEAFDIFFYYLNVSGPIYDKVRFIPFSLRERGRKG